MNLVKTGIGRRSFLKKSSVVGGGLFLSFNWLSGCEAQSVNESHLSIPDEWFDLNAYLKIGENGVVTIMSPNPEGGQNVKTSMPMIVAEELDVDWEKVIVEQAPLNTDAYNRQFIGGSQAIRQGWKALRMAGATARQMVLSAAAKNWNVPVEELSTSKGMVYHVKTDSSMSYGEIASAAAGENVPDEVSLKDISDFKIIGTSRKNVDGKDIVTGKPLFGIDTAKEGMLTAMIIHPPAFGMKFKSMDTSKVKSLPGIRDVFPIKVLEDDFERQHFDTCTFLEIVAIVGESTWQVMKAKKALEVEWTSFDSYTEERTYYRQSKQMITIPAGLESSTDHVEKMKLAASFPEIQRIDGDPDKAFKEASKILERTYNAPFLAHNCMEPMNFFADVKEDSAELAGPLQKPELTELALSARLGIPVENINIQMTRLGGGYGRRSYSHWLIEAALISQRVKAPVKLMYSREDDMTGGIYRPAYQATYRAAIDKEGNLSGFHVSAGGVPESPLYANRFPAGAIDNYLAESWTVDTNITIGSFRAPRSNFIAGAEQAFLDELAEELGKDPVKFRLELLKRAEENPVGESNDYDPVRYAGVIELCREKSNWDEEAGKRGFAAYYCHNSYCANVVEVSSEERESGVKKVTSAVDCGIVINPDAATNLAEGAIVDAIGTSMFGELSFENGAPTKSNFDQYRMIRHSEAPKEIEVHFVENDIDPTGMGEPTYPPVMGALANAIYRSNGKRIYKQPFIKDFS